MINEEKTYLPYADERRIDFEAIFELVDVDASTTATATGSKGTFFSMPFQTHDKISYMTRKIATSEPNEWKLDGSFFLVKENLDNDEIGYWSDALSDEDGNIETHLYFEFATRQTSRGITVIFDDRTENYATDFKVIAYGAKGNVIAETTVTGNDSYMASADMLAEKYRKLEIIFTKTNKPKRRIRVVEVVFGYLRAFNNDDIVSLDVDYETSLYGNTLPTNRLSLTIDNSDRRYNIINPTGIYRYLQKGQGINASVLVGGNRVQLGRFFFDNSRSDDSAMTVTITAYDKIYLLSDTNINVGGAGTWTLTEAVNTIVKASNINISTYIDPEIAGRVIGRGIPPNTSVREALRLVAQAARCICYFNRVDILSFVEPKISDVVDYLDNDKMAQFPTISDTGLINSVEIEARNDYDEDAKDKVFKAQNIAIDEEERKISISNPCVISNEVAEWVLSLCRYRITYNITERGNPARELIDTVNIADIYGENRNGITLRQSVKGGKGLSGTLEVVTDYE